jgi:RimJ/RimL family protein N-acetyltransferase
MPPAREFRRDEPAKRWRVLSGRLIELVPLDRSHAADLYAAGADADIWRHLPGRPFADVADVERWIEQAQQLAAQGRELPFAIVSKSEERAIGSTRYLDIRPEEKAVEIGWTWLAKAHQRTGANTEAKYLMLKHAFEDRGFLRVGFFTDAQNGRARAALVRIGATYEGTLRLHRARLSNGFARDSAVYSVIAPEWSSVRNRLEMKLKSASRR